LAGFQFPPELFDHDIDNPADRLDQVSVRFALEGKQHLHQIEIGLQFPQRGRIGEQSGKTEIIERMALNGLEHRGRKQPAAVAEPVGNGDLARVE
jgi:hypothetical protein